MNADAAGHALAFGDGSRLGYDKLLRAVGSQGRTAPWPGAEGNGLHYFVTLRDLEALGREAQKGMAAAVVGGGWIGVRSGGGAATATVMEAEQED